MINNEGRQQEKQQKSDPASLQTGPKSSSTLSTSSIHSLLTSSITSTKATLLKLIDHNKQLRR